LQTQLNARSLEGRLTLIIDALAAHTGIAEPLLTPQLVRQIIRQELQHQESWRLEPAGEPMGTDKSRRRIELRGPFATWLRRAAAPDMRTLPLE
jgi:hypothetical protein